jgi:[NiFe] hydrogenase diaphorase moiety small subunit
MSDPIRFTIDGREITAQPGQTILQAAEANGIYIPRLCAHPELKPHGSCRVCLVKVNGRPQAACTQPVAPKIAVESETAEVLDARRAIVEMLFVEGNHFCPSCEKSGNCELQAVAYRLGISAPRYPYQFPRREMDASHPQVLIDQDRCIQCGRCVAASRDLDGKSVFEFVGRSDAKRLAVNAAALGDTDLAVADRAVGICPVGAIIRKRVGFAVPVGQRQFDTTPIGADVER